MTETYFADSYAIIELVRANANYRPFLDAHLEYTQLNLFEAYHAFAKQWGEKRANELMDGLQKPTEFDNDTIRRAALMKMHFKERRMSMADVIGYVVAIKKGIPFLTGDQQFKDLPNVAFVR